MAVAAGTLMFVACGDDVTEVHKDGMAVLEKGEKLSKQACDKTNVGEMLFVMDSSEAFICDGESWKTLKGEDGKNVDSGTAVAGCSAKSVKNKSKTREGIEVTCGETVVDTIWNGEKGDNGETGKSAYEIAKENGFEGTETEWLESMKGPFIQDKRDGKIYKTVKIGDQVWMAENLNYDPNYLTKGAKDSIILSWCYNDSVEYCEKYGRLYTWAAAMVSVAAFSNDGKGCGYSVECEPSETVRGICPEGWHLPDTTEWKTLFATVAGKNVAAKMLKSASGWNDYDGLNVDGLDAYGFSAIPAGFRGDEGKFFDTDDYASFWSATEDKFQNREKNNV